MTETLPGIVDIDPDDLEYGREHAVKQTPVQHERIKQAVKRAREMESDIAQAELALKLLKAEYNRTMSVELPELMDECGVTELKLDSGLAIKVTKQLWASIPSNTAINEERDVTKRRLLVQRRQAAIKWLEENGHSDLIQRDFNIQFGRGEEEWADQFRESLQNMDRELHVTEGENVNAGTLSKLVREMAEDDEKKNLIPREILGVFEKKNTKITVQKK